jgi:hypothetical protein
MESSCLVATEATSCPALLLARFAEELKEVPYQQTKQGSPVEVIQHEASRGQQ